MFRKIALGLSLIGGTLMVGCTGTSSTNSTDATEQTDSTNDPSESSSETYSHVIRVQTEYYTTGPQQGRPPDGTFSAGTKVNVVEESGSYTRVRSEEGVEAFVSADAVIEKDTDKESTGSSGY